MPPLEGVHLEIFYGIFAADCTPVSNAERVCENSPYCRNDGMISALDTEIFYDTIYRRFRSPADDVAA